MMSLNEIAVQLAAPYGKQFDEPFLAMVKDLVVVWTGRIIRDSLKNAPNDRKFFKTTIFLPLHEASGDCGATDCTIMETQDIPTPLRANSILFDFVGSRDGSTPFHLVTEGFEQLWKANRFASRYLTYRWTGKRIQVLASERPLSIKVVAVWEDPRALAALMCGSGGNCFPDDQPYQVNNDILQSVMKYVAEESLRAYKPQSQLTEVSIDHDAAVTSNGS